MLKSRFVPVALDQAYQRRQKDTEGDFYRKIAAQSPRSDFRETTQGLYIATAAGRLLLYNNNRDPAKLRRLISQKLREFEVLSARSPASQPIHAVVVDPQYNVTPPEGGLVLRVRAKVLDGYGRPTNRWQRIFQTALSRDNLWISSSEHRSLVQGTVPERLQRRIARFHCVDNTRGEPSMWREEDVGSVHMQLDDGQLTGNVQLAAGRRNAGFEASMRGKIDIENEEIVRFDLVILGDFWGEGRFTPGAPQGKYPLAISFTLADGTDVADHIPPQASRGWLRGYGL